MRVVSWLRRYSSIPKLFVGKRYEIIGRYNHYCCSFGTCSFTQTPLTGFPTTRITSSSSGYKRWPANSELISLTMS